MTLQDPLDRSTTGLLGETLRALESAGIAHCLLRAPARGAEGGSRKEADLLVDARDLGRLGSVVRSMGFAPIASWGCGSHRFYVMKDGAAEVQLKLDVVTSLRFGGRAGVLGSRALGDALRRSGVESGVHVLDPADAFLAMILHCVLDKNAMRESHRRELGRLAAQLESDDPARRRARERFRAALGTGLSVQDAMAAVRGGAPETLLRRRLRIAWELARREPVESVARWTWGKLSRAIHRLRAFSQKPERLLSG